MGIKIVLVEPSGEINLGSIARVMKNMGLSELVLVNPQCDRNSLEARKMAVHAVEILEEAIIVDSLSNALSGVHRAIATTARSRSLDTKLETPREALKWLVGENINSALIFGPEDRGLSNQELNYGHRFITIPSSPIYPSLNLAQAVAVCAYELYQIPSQQNNNSTLDNINLVEKATVESLENYYKDLEKLLLDIGYLYPQTASAKMAKLRRLYNRGNITTQEIALLRGMISQIRWAIKSGIVE